MVNNLGVVLGTNARQELALCLWNAEAFKRLLDLIGDVVPRLLLALGRLAVVDDLPEVDPAEVAAPVGHRPLREVVVRAQAELEHPVRLALDRADLLHGRAGEPAAGFVEVDDVVVEAVLGAPIGDELAGVGHLAPAGWVLCLSFAGRGAAGWRLAAGGRASRRG